MSYAESNLIAGERVVYQTRLHWIVMFWHLFLGLLQFGLAGFLLYTAFNRAGFDSETVLAMKIGGGLLLLSGIAVILVGILRRSATEMAVTNRRVIIKTGLAHRKTIEMLLNKVESIEVNESLLGRTMGFGTIVVIGTGGTLEPFQKVAHPLEFRNQVQQQIEHHP